MPTAANIPTTTSPVSNLESTAYRPFLDADIRPEYLRIITSVRMIQDSFTHRTQVDVTIHSSLPITRGRPVAKRLRRTKARGAHRLAPLRKHETIHRFGSRGGVRKPDAL